MVSRELLPIRVVVTWVILVLAAVVSPVLTFDSHGGEVAAVGVLTLAAVKVRLVGLDFMELRRAPVPLRVAFETYCAGSWLMLSGFFVFT